MSVLGSGVKISLRVYPNAARDEVLGFTDGVCHIKVAAPPVKGKANEQLIAFLGQLLGVSKSSVSIIKGHTSRSKLIAIDGLSREDVMKRLSSSSGGGATRGQYPE